MPRLTPYSQDYRRAAGAPRFHRSPRCACGKPASTGWTDGERHERCAICEVAEAPTPRRSRPPHQRSIGLCACGCGREGALVGSGLVRLCYGRLRRAGLLTAWKEAHSGR